jgi:hypothetical protein
MEQGRVEAVLTGEQNCTPQAARLCWVAGPHRLVVVHRIETPQQLIMHSLPGHSQLAREIESRLEFGITNEGWYVWYSNVGFVRRGAYDRWIRSGHNRDRSQGPIAEP